MIKTGAMTFLEAALEILKREGKALHFKDLTERAMSKKLLTFVGRTPEVTMQAQLTAAVKKAPGNPFVRVKPGVFGLLRYPELTAEEKAALEKEKSKDKDKDKDKGDGDKSDRRRGKAREAVATETSRDGRRRRRRRGGRSRAEGAETNAEETEGLPEGEADERADAAAAAEDSPESARKGREEAEGDDGHADEPTVGGGLSAEARAAALAETGVFGEDQDDEDDDGEDDEDDADGGSEDMSEGAESTDRGIAEDDDETAVAAQGEDELADDSDDDDLADQDDEDDDEGDEDEQLAPGENAGSAFDTGPGESQNRPEARPLTAATDDLGGAADDEGEDDAEDDAREASGGAAEGGPREGDELGGRRRRRRRRRRRGGLEGGAFGGPNDPQASGEARSFGEAGAPPSAMSEAGTETGEGAASAGEGGSEGLPLESQQGPRKISTPVDAALEILRSQAPGRGMHVRQLSDAAVRRRLVHGEPNEAWRVMRAALAAEPKERLRAGRRPRIRAAGSGLFALARRPPEGELEKAEAVFAEARRALRERTMVALEKRLADLPPPAFEALARVLLQREGFGPATFVKRVEGTIYIEALRGRGSRPSKCLIALRAGGSSAGRRAIGELRAGVRARNQDEGLLFLVGRLADDAIAEWKQPGPPIEIADGAALAETCVRHGLGVITATLSVDFVDADFFTELAEG